MRRAQASTAPTSVAIIGLCPKCDGWFACDDYFNPTAAMPCCPHCRLAPARLGYRFPHAAGAVEVDATDTDAGIPGAPDVPAAVTPAPPARCTDQHGGSTASIEHPETTTATVITMAGALATESMTRLLDMLAAQYAHGEVIIDLSGVTMTSPPAIRGLVARLSAWSDTATVRIVCNRLTARQLLHKWGGASLPLTSTMANALDALSQHPLHPHASVATASPHQSR